MNMVSQSLQDTGNNKLREAWLKRLFASWEYHEELLLLHEQYLLALHRHWDDKGRQERHPEIYKTMLSPVFFNFDQVSKPGTIARSEWDRRTSAGEANAIAYNFNRGLGDFGPPFDEYAEMSQLERDRLNRLVGEMLCHCTNIRRTIDDTWETNDSDTILNPRYTGPIDWPDDWRDEVVDLDPVAPANLRIEAGQRCPLAGHWFTPARQRSRRYFQQGEVMPDLGGSWGITIWQWDPNQ